MVRSHLGALLFVFAEVAKTSESEVKVVTDNRIIYVLPVCRQAGVYILQSLKDYNLYIGYTDDLERRLEEHNEGKNFSTKSRLPFKMIFYEALPTIEEAVEREKFYKSGRGHEVIYKILFKTLPR